MYYLNLLKAHLGCKWLTVDLLLHGKLYSLTDDESLNTSLVDVIETLGEIVLVRDGLGDRGMLPREWYLRGDSIFFSTYLETMQNEERWVNSLLFGGQFILMLLDDQLSINACFLLILTNRVSQILLW